MSGKYNAKRTEVDGITFASKRESDRYKELKLLESIDMISDLVLQPCFELQPAFVTADGKKERAVKYVGDFAYTDNETGERIIEDSKGYRNQLYLLKRKLLLFKYPHITFLET